MHRAGLVGGGSVPTTSLTCCALPLLLGRILGSCGCSRSWNNKNVLLELIKVQHFICAGATGEGHGPRLFLVLVVCFFPHLNPEISLTSSLMKCMN